ncbi:unnamed protein product, partial [Rotaria sp. Silwood2]
DQFAAVHLIEITNELRRTDKTNIDAFKYNSPLK